jgi:gamma-glutamyltranspeptidase / glutathione hydrolase
MAGAKVRLPQYRGVVMGRGGMVASANPLASAAGLQVLREGGTAADAVIAAALVTGVTICGTNGLGGDMFCLYYDAASRTVTGFNGSGAAGQLATIDEMRKRGVSILPFRGPLTCTVPGAIHGYAELHGRFGTMPWPRLFDDAIRYAGEGHPVHERTANALNIASQELRDETEWHKVYASAGRTPKAGEVLAQPDYARSLRLVAEGGREAYYQGEIGRRIVQTLEQRGGLLTDADLAAHTTEVYTPLSTTYRGLTVHETRPPSQGFLVLEMLNIIEQDDIASMGFGSAEAIHLMVEAKKLAFADRIAHMGDPRHVDAPTDELISKAYAADRRRLIDRARAQNAVPAGMPRGVAADTTYLCAVDGKGNAASFIHTLFAGMGSGVTVPGTGIVLTNRGAAFSLDPAHPNAMQPGKRTMHTLNCYALTQGDELVLVGGTPGADSQPQWNVQTLTNLYDFGMNVQQAVEAPRWVSTPGTQPATWNDEYVLQLEEGFDPETVAGLERLGHTIQMAPLGLGGHVQLIRRDPQSGVLFGASDPRGDGAAMTF